MSFVDQGCEKKVRQRHYTQQIEFDKTKNPINDKR